MSDTPEIQPNGLMLSDHEICKIIDDFRNDYIAKVNMGAALRHHIYKALILQNHRQGLLHERELSTLRAENERLREAVNIVKGLAEWSKKYPRETVYSMSRKEKIDGELIALEDRAKDFEKAINPQEPSDGT